MNFKTNVPYLNNQALENCGCLHAAACKIHLFITSILKSLRSLQYYLIGSQQCHFFQQNDCTIFPLNCVFFFSANEKGSHYNAIKWKLKFVSGSFVPKSYLWFQINMHCMLVQFWNHRYDFIPRCTPLSSITIILTHLKSKQKTELII